MSFLETVRDWMRCSRMETPASSLREVLQAMRERGGWRLEEKEFKDGGRPIPETESLVKGHNIRFLQNLDTTLSPEDEVVVFIHRSWADVPFL